MDPRWKHRGNPLAYKTVCISDLPHCRDRPVKSLIHIKKKKNQPLTKVPCYIPTAINSPKAPSAC